MRLRKVFVIAATLTTLVLMATPGSAAAPPSTLTGEMLIANGPGLLSACANSGTFDFSIAGTASGPYPGTFTETGRATVGPARTVTAFSATFTIRSPLGTVTGTKDLSGMTGIGCYTDAMQARVTNAPTTYRATIATPSGAYTDRGTSVVGDLAVVGNASMLSEDFTSAQTQTTATGPTGKDQCSSGGYKNFMDPNTGKPYTNQGQCIQATKGR